MLQPFFVFSREDQTKLPEAIYVPEIHGWSELGKASVFARIHWLRRMMAAVLEPLWHGYFSSKLIRRFIDNLKLFRLFTGTKLFNIPPIELQNRLLERVLSNLPRISSDQPVLVEMWRKGESLQLHLVNYADNPQLVQVSFDHPVKGEIISPDSDQLVNVSGADIMLELNVYSILIIKE